MPQLTIDQCMTIMGYLNTEGFSKKTLTALDDEIVNFLAANGYTVPVYGKGRGANNPVIGGGSQYSAMMSAKKFWNDSNIMTFLGLNGEGEADNYTRNISAPPATNTGTSASTKVNSAGDPLPSRNLGPEYFDHNGMMARNILSIASTGLPDPTWIIAAKNVAAGTNYLSAFPAQLGDTYVMGNNLVHPNLATATPTPTPTPTATPTPAPVTSDDEDEDMEEVVEIEETPKPEADKRFYPDNPPQEPESKCLTPMFTGRSLNDATYAARATNYNGFYPYGGTIKISLQQDSQNDMLQPPVTSTNVMLDLFADTSTQSTSADASPAVSIDICDGTLKVNSLGELVYQDDYTSLEVRWVRGTEEIDALVVRNGSDEIFRMENNQIVDFDFLVNSFNNIWCAPDLIADAGEINFPFIYFGPSRDSDYGITTVSSSKDDYNEALNELRDKGAVFGYYSKAVPASNIQASLESYLGGIEDLDGTFREENYWLSRVVGDIDEELDTTQTYLAVNIIMSGDTGRNSDLFVGTGEMRQETLIFPGDEQELDLLLTPFIDNKTVMGELEIDSAGLRQLMLAEIKTSAPQQVMDDEGNPTGETLISDVSLMFENMMNNKSLTINIPNPDDEFAAVDLLGTTIRGKVESIELKQGDPAAAHEKQKLIRRQERMSDNWNVRNGSKTDQNATSTVAFEKGRKYYIVGRHKDKPILLELELEF